MKRLALTAVAVGALWVTFDRTIVGDWEHTDSIILAEISASFLFASLVMLIGTPRWSARSLGLLLTSLGTSALAGWAVISREITHDAAPEWNTHFVRAVWAIGGPLLIIGVVTWVTANWTPRQITTAGYRGPERRSGAPGRRSSDYERAEL